MGRALAPCNFLPTDTMDIYRIKKGQVLLVDFNPFASMTNSLLFSWEELYELAIPTENSRMPIPVVRIIEDPTGIQPSDMSESRLPKVKEKCIL